MKKYVFTFLACSLPLVVLLVIEIGFRIFWIPPWQREGVGEIKPEIYYAYAAPRAVGFAHPGPVVSLNSHGFRNPEEFNFEKPKDEFRVVYLGASVAFGSWSSSYDNTSQAILEKCLHVPGKKVKVLSLAEGGDEAADEVFWLTKLGFRLKPDLIISLTGYNDMIYSSVFPTKWDMGSGSRVYYRPRLLGPRQSGTFHNVVFAFGDFFFKLERWIYYQSRAYEYLKYVTDLERPGSELKRLQRSLEVTPLAMKTMPLAASSFVDAYKMVRTVAKARNIDFLLFFQPVRGCHESSPSPSRDQIYCDNLRKTFGDLEYVDMSKKVGAELSAANTFVDPVHLTDKGFAILGKSMCDVLNARLNPSKRSVK